VRRRRRRRRRRSIVIVVVVVVWELYYSSLKKLKITSLLRPAACTFSDFASSFGYLLFCFCFPD
jgi:hypothetical protein